MACCENCTYPLGYTNWINKIKNLIYLKKLKDKSGKLLYPDSNFTYCLDCWEKKEEFKCEKCNNDIIAYNCEKDMPDLIYQELRQQIKRNYKKVCFNCKCDGSDCEYC